MARWGFQDSRDARSVARHGAWNEQSTDRAGLNDFAWAGVVLTSFPRAMLIMAGMFGLWRAGQISNALFAAGVGAVVLVLLGGTTWLSDGFWAPDGAYSSREENYGAAAVTRQTTLPTSSATSNAPRLSIATPTGRPWASPRPFRKPVTTSIGSPDGRPRLNGMKITL